MSQVQINPESTARIYRQIADMLESPPEGVDFQRIKKAAVEAIRFLAADQVHHRQHLDEWRAEIARLHIGLAKPQWLPIDTAPQDGISVLGFGRMDGEISGHMGPPSATVMQCRYGEWTVTHTDAYSVQVFPHPLDASS